MVGLLGVLLVFTPPHLEAILNTASDAPRQRSRGTMVHGKLISYWRFPKEMGGKASHCSPYRTNWKQIPCSSPQSHSTMFLSPACCLISLLSLPDRGHGVSKTTLRPCASSFRPSPCAPSSGQQGPKWNCCSWIMCLGESLLYLSSTPSCLLKRFPVYEWILEECSKLSKPHGGTRRGGKKILYWEYKIFKRYRKRLKK